MGVWPSVVQTDRDRVGGRKLKQAVEYLEYLGGRREWAMSFQQHLSVPGLALIRAISHQFHAQ